MNEENKVKWILIVLFLLLIGGVVGVFIYQNYRYKDVYFEYNGFAVHKGADKSGNIIYQTRIFIGNDNQPYLITTRYNPKDLEAIKVENDIKKDLLKKEIFITMDSSSTAKSVLAATEISKITGNFLLYSIPTHGALLTPVEGKNITIKTCSDVTQEQAIILLRQANQSKIYSENGCIILEGQDEYDLIRVTNRMILTLLGVMEA